ncbi:MAG: outer membrane lipoprotein carrier protein LolA [Nitrospirota bacterium]|nr:outer membrane lipoprotein carrier protein LolA [Nitrospirota bacterium]
MGRKLVPAALLMGAALLWCAQTSSAEAPLADPAAAASAPATAPADAPADTRTDVPTFDRLLGAFKGVRSLSAEFVQESRFAGFSTPRRFAGVVEIVRPGKMRWDYREGSNQQIYVNDREIVVHTPDMRQAILSSLSPSSDRQIPIFLLADVTRIGEAYWVKPGATSGQLVLTPRERDPQAPQQVLLDVGDDGLIRKVALEMPGGNQSEITFSHQQVNPAIAASRFRFSAPPDTNVVRPEAAIGGGKSRGGKSR